MHEIAIGRGQRLVDGNDVAVLTIGPMANKAAAAIERARRENGIEAAHYDMIFLKPLDDTIMEEAARSGRPIVTVEDGTVDGGLGGAVLEWLAERGYSLPVTRMGIPDAFVPQGTVAELRRLCRYDAAAIAETIMNFRK